MQNMKNYILAIMVFVILIHSAFADISITNITTIPSVIRPGSSGVVSMVISNPSSDNANSVRVEGTGSSFIQNILIEGLGDFMSGVSSTASLPFRVSEKTPAGIYNLQYRFSWINSTATRYKVIMVPITVTNPAIFSMQTVDSAIYTSGDFNVNVNISNFGGSAKDIRISLNSTKFLQAGANPITLDKISKSTTESFNLQVALASNVDSGVYLVPVTITYIDEAGSEQVGTANLRLIVKIKNPSFSISQSSDTHLYPGKNVKLKLKLENTGDDTAYDARVRLATLSDISLLQSESSTQTQDLHALTLIGANNIKLGNILSSAKKDITLNVGVANTVPGFYHINFIIEYKDSNGDSQKKLVTLGMQIEAQSDIDVFVSAKPTPIVSGAEHTLSILVSNVGSSTIKAVTVKIEGDGFELQEAQPTQFIGGIDEDDFSTVQYKVKLSPKLVGGEHNLDVILNYKDAYNNLHTQRKTISLNVVNANDEQNGFSPFTMFIGGIVLLIILTIIWFRFFRKKKPADKHKH